MRTILVYMDRITVLLTIIRLSGQDKPGRWVDDQRLNSTTFRASVLVVAMLALPFSAHAELVKKSSSGICHPLESSYYDRTKNFISYNSLTDCLVAGGRLPKAMTHSGAHNASIDTKAQGGYQRGYFGQGWLDADNDCRSSRHEALVAQSTAPVHFDSSGECNVTIGRWISPFTNSVIHDASSIDIDHVVPLKWAWEHGADKWSQDERESFANDLINLLSVEASLNRSKGAQGLDQWLPPRNQCQYILRFARILKVYNLLLDTDEAESYQAVRHNACEQ